MIHVHNIYKTSLQSSLLHNNLAQMFWLFHTNITMKHHQDPFKWYKFVVLNRNNNRAKLERNQFIQSERKPKFQISSFHEITEVITQIHITHKIIKSEQICLVL